MTDGNSARVMERENHVAHLQCVHDMSNAHESKYEHQYDRPGRTFESGTTGSHAYESKTSWTDYRKELFMREIAAFFVEEHRQKKFPKVCLIGPPDLMPILRENIQSYLVTIHESKRPKIVEIPKNLTYQTVKEIEDLLVDNVV